MDGESLGHVAGRDHPELSAQQSDNDLLGQVEIAMGVEQLGQTDGSVGRDQQAQPAPVASPTQSKPAPAGQLFISVDDDDCRDSSEFVWRKPRREAPLAIVQFKVDHTLPGGLDDRNERRQQRRLAAAVRTDDLALPMAVAKATDKALGRCPGCEDIGHTPWTNVPGGEGVRAWDGVSGVTHDGMNFGAGMLPRRNGCWPTTCLPRGRNTRTRTHHRIFTIIPV